MMKSMFIVQNRARNNNSQRKVKMSSNSRRRVNAMRFAVMSNRTTSEVCASDDDDEDEDIGDVKNERVVVRLITMTMMTMMVTMNSCNNRDCAFASAYDQRDENYMENIASTVSADEALGKRTSLKKLVQGEHKKEIERCAGKCITTCVRGTNDTQSNSLLAMRSNKNKKKDEMSTLVVFKDRFRSRNYCIEECLEYCSKAINK